MKFGIECMMRASPFWWKNVTHLNASWHHPDPHGIRQEHEPKFLALASWKTCCWPGFRFWSHDKRIWRLSLNSQHFGGWLWFISVLLAIFSQSSHFSLLATSYYSLGYSPAANTTPLDSADSPLLAEIARYRVAQPRRHRSRGCLVSAAWKVSASTEIFRVEVFSLFAESFDVAFRVNILTEILSMSVARFSPIVAYGVIVWSWCDATRMAYAQVWTIQRLGPWLQRVPRWWVHGLGGFHGKNYLGPMIPMDVPGTQTIFDTNRYDDKKADMNLSSHRFQIQMHEIGLWDAFRGFLSMCLPIRWLLLGIFCTPENHLLIIGLN